MIEPLTGQFKLRATFAEHITNWANLDAGLADRDKCQVNEP